MAKPVLSWGRAHSFDHDVHALPSTGPLDLNRVAEKGAPILAHGLGRSYGDVALNDGGHLLLTPRRDDFLTADWDTGVIRARSGLSLADLHQVTIPRGWFVAVTPGSKFVTLGGAVANDVHGKNHHQAGSFGVHVLAVGLVHSERGPLTLSRDEHPDLFALTIGGLGLTGFIDWVEIQLQPIASSNMDVENLAFDSLDGFFDLSLTSADWPYTVAWVDCFASGAHLGRGIFTRARFASEGPLNAALRKKGLKWPMTTPAFMMNRLSIGAFNWLYRNRPGARFTGEQSYDPFFYPLDAIQDWNKLYGSRGFYQHQSLIPPDAGRDGVTELLRAIGKSGQGSFLAVLKIHGPESSPGVMSFCREGVSLALDFANKGPKTLKLLDELDQITADHRGRTYPAKDGRMSAEFFKASYPRWVELEAARDPAFSSSFWRRVSA
ncbi:MAG: FAD-binding oxidoreductase [Pseudomonadota bacterium]